MTLINKIVYIQVIAFSTDIFPNNKIGSVGVDNILVYSESGITDNIPPVTTHDFTYGDQWLTAPITINLTSTDEGSGVAGTYYQIGSGQVINGNAINLTEDGEHTISFWAEDQASNKEETQSLTVKMDQTPPVIQPTFTPAPNANGWNRGDVTVSFTAQDNLSGVKTVSEPVKVREEGIQEITAIAEDTAGNTAQEVVSVKIDKTAPVIGDIYPQNGSYINIKRPTLTVGCWDSLSGVDPSSVRITLDGSELIGVAVDSSEVAVTVPYDLADGRHTMTVSLADMAGNSIGQISSNFTVDVTMPNILA